MVRIAAAAAVVVVSVVLVVATAATTANHHNKKVVLLGLPKSGSYRIHQFIQCMNQNQKVDNNNNPKNDASLSSQQQQQHPNITTLSSAHYCCDPHRRENGENNSHHDDENNNDEASFFFPCPTHMIPCGTCMHDYYMNHHRDTSTTTASWMEHCGNYDVYANFHVEGTTGDSDYTFFLPQHFALAHLVGDDSHHDEMNTNSTTTWIYHHRATAAQWATHVAHWYSITHRLLHAFGVPYYYENENNEPKDTDKVVRTLDDLQHELDTTSMERLHNQTDQQRRYIELVAIHDHFQNTIQQFVHDYNNHRHDDDDPLLQSRNRHQIQLYDINIDDDDDDDSNNTPGTLARALEYDDHHNVARSCWSTTDAPNETDYRDFQLTTTFRASV